LAFTAFIKLKLLPVKRVGQKLNDFLADRIKCMVNRISKETHRKNDAFYPPISWPFLLRGTLFHICNRQINYRMKRKMFTITMAWLCLWQIILKILPTPHLLPKLKCEKKGLNERGEKKKNKKLTNWNRKLLCGIPNLTQKEQQTLSEPYSYPELISTQANPSSNVNSKHMDPSNRSKLSQIRKLESHGVIAL